MAFAGFGTCSITLANKIYPFGIHFVVLYGVSLVYAISRYRLMDVTLIINKTLILIFALSLFLGSFSVFSWLLSVRLGLSYPLANTLSISIIATVMIFFRERFLKIAEYFIYHGRYAYQKVLRDASTAMVSMLDLDELLNYLMKIIVDSISPLKACLFIEDEAKSLYVIKTGYAIEPELKSGYFLSNEKGIIPFLKEKKMTFVREEMMRALPEEKFASVYQDLEKIGAEVNLPIFYKDHLLGLLTLDNKVSGRIYDQTDLDILEYLAKEAAVSIANAQLYIGAITDGLTGLYHHRYFQQELSREVERSKRYKHPLSLILIDIDYFKQLNDTYGHQAGDVVLKELAKFLKANIRKVDIPARYGGEEFAYILIEATLENALVLSRRLNQEVKDINFLPKIQEERIALKEAPKDNKLSIAVSIGVAYFDGQDPNMTPEQIIHQADMALYQAKEQGRDRVCS
jgi:diguanylate cyclase (GGDEF)-like protein